MFFLTLILIIVMWAPTPKEKPIEIVACVIISFYLYNIWRSIQRNNFLIKQSLLPENQRRDEKSFVYSIWNNIFNYY
jgi:hypothetical protein